MANKPKTDSNTTFDGFHSMYNRYVNYVTSLTKAKRQSLFISGTAITVALAVLGSIPFLKTDWWIWVQTVVAFPAGIILFAILVGVVKTTSVGNWSIFDFKSTNSHIQRIRKVSIIIALLVAAFILFGSYLPYGVGGVLMIAIILTMYNLLSRTPEEVALAKRGIIDPRDIERSGNVPVDAVADLENNNDEVIIPNSSDITRNDRR